MRRAKYPILLTGVWMLAILLVDPVGDFPLNDDWAFARTVQLLLETGEFHLSDWASMNLLSQSLWGASFCLPLGFSFTALRVSTLVLGWIGLLATFGILREAKASAPVALLGSLVVALNPVYFALAHSFNTDVPSFAFAVTSLYFLLRGLRLDSSVQIAVGILLSLVSVMNRQSGIVVLAAFGLALLVKRGPSLRNAALAVAPTLAALVLNFAFSTWLARRGELPYLYSLQITLLFNTLSAGLSHVAFVYSQNLPAMSVYLGLFLFPFLFIVFFAFRASFPSERRWIASGAVLVAALAGIGYAQEHGPMPYSGNVLDRFAIGPISLAGYFSGLGPHTVESLQRVWLSLALLGAAGGVFLLVLLVSAAIAAIRRGRDDRREPPWAFALHFAIVCGYLASVAGLGAFSWFDRYLMFPLPMLMAISVMAVQGPTELRGGVMVAICAVASLLLAGVFTIAATHDYLAWNRARWRALDHLVNEQAVPPARIDGGLEFNGWHSGFRLKTCNPELREVQGAMHNWPAFKCIFGAPQDANRVYGMAFVPKAGYSVVDRVSFRRWLPWAEQDVYLLKRAE